MPVAIDGTDVPGHDGSLLGHAAGPRYTGPVTIWPGGKGNSSAP